MYSSLVLPEDKQGKRYESSEWLVSGEITLARSLQNPICLSITMLIMTSKDSPHTLITVLSTLRNTAKSFLKSPGNNEEQ